MTKISGLAQNFYLDGNDLSGDTGSASRIGGGPATLEVTGIDKSAFERIPGKRDGGIEWSSWFNPDQAHPVISTLPTTDRIASWFVGTTLGDPVASTIAKQINYDGTRGDDGSFSFAVQALGSGFGLEWGRQLTAGKRSDTGAANGAGYDAGAGTTFGIQAYLHVFSFTGTDVTIKVQQSQDNGSGDAYTDVLIFDETTSAPEAQRAAVTGTVEQWLRVVTSTTGGFTECTFAVAVTRNEIATAF